MKKTTTKKKVKPAPKRKRATKPREDNSVASAPPIPPTREEMVFMKDNMAVDSAIDLTIKMLSDEPWCPPERHARTMSLATGQAMMDKIISGASLKEVIQVTSQLYVVAVLRLALQRQNKLTP